MSLIIKIILLILGFFMASSNVSAQDILKVDLVDEYNLYSANKILITTYIDGKDEVMAAVAGQQEAAQIRLKDKGTDVLASFAAGYMLWELL